MANEVFYPSLSSLIPVKGLPQNLGFIQNLADNIFDGLFYKNFQTNTSKSGNRKSFHLTLVSYNKIGFEIPGTGIIFILNPAAIPDSGSEIPISIGFQWEVFRFLQSFEISQFDGSPNSLFNIIITMAEANSDDIVREVVYSFIGGSNPINDFIINYNSAHPGNSITVLSDPDPNVYIQNITDAFDAQSIDLFQIIFNDYIFDNNEIVLFKNIEKLLFKFLGFFSVDRIKKMLIPQINASIDEISVGVQFPASILREVNPVNFDPLQDSNGKDVPSILRFTLGSIGYDTETGFEFKNVSTISLPSSEILQTGFTLQVTNLKLDLSRKNNIPEAIADNRPDDFIGVYITQGTIGFPSFLNHDDTNSNAELFVNNLLVGTGGISGTIGLKLKDGQSGTPNIKIKVGGFELIINTFSLTFRQNAIIGSDIKAEMTLPWFKDEYNESFKLDVLVHFEQNGEFNITAIPNQPIPALKQEGVFTLFIKSFSVGNKGDRFFLSISGDLSFENSSIGNFLSSAVSVKELIIWDDGKIEFKGGFNPLPKSVNLQLGPAKISVTNIHLGQDQRTFNGELIDYKFFGFDAALSLDPEGLDLRGDGIKLYYAFDPSDGSYIDAFMRIQGINIDLYIPASAPRERANVIIKGYLRLKNDPNGLEEYQGGIDFSMPNKGIAASAAMTYKPKVPSFLVDASLTLATPLVLGATGLGIYGFRGIFGRRYVPSKTKIGLTEDARWWEFYKEDYNGGGQGIYPDKYLGKDGTTFGAGISLATIPDQGRSFSSKLVGMFMPDGSSRSEGFAILRPTILALSIKAELF